MSLLGDFRLYIHIHIQRERKIPRKVIARIPPALLFLVFDYRLQCWEYY